MSMLHGKTCMGHVEVHVQVCVEYVCACVRAVALTCGGACAWIYGICMCMCEVGGVAHAELGIEPAMGRVACRGACVWIYGMCICTCAYTCMYTHTCMYVYLSIYIHTYIYT